jgi:flagellar hook-associated protein 3 FlgL
MRITTAMSHRHVVADLQRAQERLAVAQRQVSSGQRIGKASDDPTGAERATRLRADLETNAAYRTAVDASQSWVSATGSAVQSLTDLVHRARELTVQAANGATTPAGRAAMQKEIDALAEQAKSTLNGAYDGHYLFSGTATDTAPYTAATGDTYQGDSGAVLRQIGPGVTVQVNVTGSAILGSLLPALRTLSTHLGANDTASLQTTDLQAMDAGLTTLTDALGQLGATANRLTAAGTRLDDLHDVTTVSLSATEDADLPQAITDLGAQQNALTSALHAGATLIQQSLLDFLR